jgi:hypothetical protein
MTTGETRALALRMSSVLETGQVEEAYAILAPILAQRTPFRLLDIIGRAVNWCLFTVADKFLDRIATEKSEGGWVVIASALGRQLEGDPVRAFARCREFVADADVWYATDIFGERVPGPALVADFWPSLDILSPWRQDTNRWIRRTVGVSVHFWAKRSLGAAERAGRADALLAFLEPMFEERDMDAVKGVGWGLKTLGRSYPQLVAHWLTRQVVHSRRPHRALLLRKSLTFLSDEQRAHIRGEV